MSKHSQLGAIVITGALTLACGSAPDEPGVHAGPSGACPLTGTSFAGNVTVPGDADCIFVDVEVSGGLELARGARFSGSGLDVDGNFHASGSSSWVLTDSTVAGGVQSERGGDLELRGNRVGGNVQIDSHDGAVVVVDNVVSGAIELTANTGGLEISENDATGPLACSENDPAPTGRANSADGTKSGQCENL